MQTLVVKKRINSVGHDFYESELGTVFFITAHHICYHGFWNKKAMLAQSLLVCFIESLQLSEYIACSPSKLREIKQIVRKHIGTYGDKELSKVLNLCKTKDLHLGGDETVFKRSTGISNDGTNIWFYLNRSI